MSDKCTSPDEFGELYKSGELVWVDPDGREWVPSHAHASLTEKVERLEKALDKRLKQEYMDEDHRLGGTYRTYEQFKQDALLESE